MVLFPSESCLESLSLPSQCCIEPRHHKPPHPALAVAERLTESCVQDPHRHWPIWLPKGKYLNGYAIYLNVWMPIAKVANKINVTRDESWMFEYDPESKRQSCAWHTKSSLRPKKARMSKSRIKTMIIVFFDIRGIVHCEFVPQGQTVNSAFYLEVLRRLKRRIARVRTDIKDTVKLHHDNATSHTAFIITNFLAQSNTPTQERDEKKTLGNRGKHPTPCYNVPEKHSCRGVSGSQHCTTDQLFYFCQSIIDSFQEIPPKKTTAIFLDMTSAFDRVWREKLREKLHNIRTYSLESRRQNKNNLDRHFGNEEPEDEISLTTSGLVDPPFSENEVKLTAFKFGKRKSPGPEGIDNTVVKALIRMHPSLLSRLFNRCLDTVCLGMVLDSLLAQRLKHWLESNELLSSFQHGFREGKSTTTALNEVLEGVEMGLNKGVWVLFVALDIDGAFNSMSWNKLMRNLMDMGCPDNLCSLVRDLLRDRRISLSFGGRKLEKNCARGCPQGSCCGPILWNILVNTVFQEELPEGARLVLYADDQFLIIEAASRAKAEKCGETSFQILSNWAYDSGLKFNVSKTKALSFKARDIRNKRKGIKWEHKPAIRIEGRRVSLVNRMTILGVGLVSPKQGSEGGDYSRESAEESGTQNHRGITHYQQ
ncbi:hypothetical protein LAZ67_4003788 [Cordylochernes scorpioides]|uniref:Reverse transcriptase domain-containing protein n=1 Tax=Cordylochernes scorpioides TaxID=51811 RepID=A0ABY6KDZ7_9ARAC|nr:hypothetical protein LAZ67_4003788 [Cordylochernes scorpioides]